MDQEQVEALLRTRFEAGEIETGLFEAGLQYVVMDVVDAQVTFAWFESMQTLAEILAARPAPPEIAPA